MDDAAIVWDPYTKTNIDKVEMVQRRAARFALNRSSPEISNRHAQWEATLKPMQFLLQRNEWEKIQNWKKLSRSIRVRLLCINFISIFVKLNDNNFLRTLQVLAVSVLR